MTHADATRGAACLADLRARETLDKGQVSTPWLQFGDTVRIEECAPLSKLKTWKVLEKVG